MAHPSTSPALPAGFGRRSPLELSPEEYEAQRESEQARREDTRAKLNSSLGALSTRLAARAVGGLRRQASGRPRGRTRRVRSTTSPAGITRAGCLRKPACWGADAGRVRTPSRLESSSADLRACCALAAPSPNDRATLESDPHAAPSSYVLTAWRIPAMRVICPSSSRSKRTTPRIGWI